MNDSGPSGQPQGTLQSLLWPALELEIRQHYANRGVTGGFRALSLRWAREAAQDALPAGTVQSVTELLGVYPHCEAHQRQQIVDALWHWCNGNDLTIPDLDHSSEADDLFQVMNQDKNPASMLPDTASLTDPVHVLRGVGQRLAARLQILGIQTLQDLLFHFPHRYQHYANLSLAEAEVGQTVAVMGRIQQGSLGYFRFGKQIAKSGVRARIADGTAKMDITWWNRWVYSSLREGHLYCFYGEVGQFNGRRFLNNPQLLEIDVATVKQNLRLAADGLQPRHTIFPIYALTQGVTNALLRKLTGALIKARMHQRLEDDLSSAVRQQFELPSIRQTMRFLHQPASQEDWQTGRRRMVFQDLYHFHLRLQQARDERRALSAPKLVVPPAFAREFDDALPFALTPEQSAAIADLLQDISRDTPAQRLIRGEAGCGKTVVAAAAMLVVAEQGWQAVLVAPTQILARQHLESIRSVLHAVRGGEALDPLQPDLLVGAQSEAEKQRVRTRIAQGQSKILVGTTALIQQTVQFHNLGLVVVDEEHRFGVLQRDALAKPRARSAAPPDDADRQPLTPHVISLSATPIPRSLNQILTGYVDVTEIRSRPAARPPVKTVIAKPSERLALFRGLERQIAQGRQAFIVYPQIDLEDEFMTVGAVEPEFAWLDRDIFPNLRLAKVHGRMPRQEMDDVMQAFKDGAIDILVATTVIEVGIDVPNATVIFIENAERFGLAQLHQLRNRVGRGSFPGLCVLVCGNQEQAAWDRLQILMEHDNGFDIAERDLAIRGPGEILGLRQSGLPDLSYAAYLDDEVIAMIETCFGDAAAPESPAHPDRGQDQTLFPDIPL